MRHHELTPPEF